MGRINSYVKTHARCGFFAPGGLNYKPRHSLGRILNAPKTPLLAVSGFGFNGVFPFQTDSAANAISAHRVFVWEFGNSSSAPLPIVGRAPYLPNLRLMWRSGASCSTFEVFWKIGGGDISSDGRDDISMAERDKPFNWPQLSAAVLNLLQVFAIVFERRQFPTSVSNVL